MLHELNHSDLLIKFGRKKNVKILLCYPGLMAYAAVAQHMK